MTSSNTVSWHYLWESEITTLPTPHRLYIPPSLAPLCCHNTTTTTIPYHFFASSNELYFYKTTTTTSLASHHYITTMALRQPSSVHHHYLTTTNTTNIPEAPQLRDLTFRNTCLCGLPSGPALVCTHTGTHTNRYPHARMRTHTFTFPLLSV